MLMNDSLLEKAIAVLEENNRGEFTVPAANIYPHQWLWDSCFIAIGLRHLDANRAKAEIHHLLRGQWSNGMVPDKLFNSQTHRDAKLWQSNRSPFSPSDVATSGITQPPMIAEAVWQVGETLPKSERRIFFHSVFKQIVDYHMWLYRERDPHDDGMVVLVHPWESGTDNSPSWVEAMYANRIPFYVRVLASPIMSRAINFLRPDTKNIKAEERSELLVSLMNFAVLYRLRRKSYDSEKILLRSHFSIQDIGFLSILVRANDILGRIAKEIDEKLPDELINKAKMTKANLEKLWDDSSRSYFSRYFVTHHLIKTPSISSLLPLYSGAIPKERAGMLIDDIKVNYKTKYLLPSVPNSSSLFKPKRYWQGPVWINTNWLIIDGLKRYGEAELADRIAEDSVKLVKKSGTAEYFEPNTGEGLGADSFSWTAALVIDLLKRPKT